jgi:hypothetical protein
LVNTLHDEDNELREEAAWALACIGEDAVPGLLEALEDKPIRWWAVKALGGIGPSAADAVPKLAHLLMCDDEYVRSCAAWALMRIGPTADTPLKQLIELLEHDSVLKTRCFAAMAIGDLGVSARVSLETLVTRMHVDPSEEVREDVAKAIQQIAKALQVDMRSISTAELRTIVSALEDASASIDDLLPDAASEDFTLSYEALEAEMRARFLSHTFPSLLQNKWVWGVIFYVMLSLISVFSLVFYPSGLLRANNFLGQFGEVKIAWPVVMTLSFRNLLVVGLFRHHHRVLDAWVRQHIRTAREHFSNIPTVQDRAIHVPLPASIDGEFVPGPNVEAFRRVFDKKLVRVLIQGEGGVGKTSLACQLGKWAMSENRFQRLSPHLMLPVLIQGDISDGFLDRVLGQLKELIGNVDAIEEDLFLKLLEKGRVLVIVDGLSEMEDASREKA